MSRLNPCPCQRNTFGPHFSTFLGISDRHSKILNFGHRRHGSLVDLGGSPAAHRPHEAQVRGLGAGEEKLQYRPQHTAANVRSRRKGWRPDGLAMLGEAFREWVVSHAAALLTIHGMNAQRKKGHIHNKHYSRYGRRSRDRRRTQTIHAKTRAAIHCGRIRCSRVFFTLQKSVYARRSCPTPKRPAITRRRERASQLLGELFTYCGQGCAFYALDMSKRAWASMRARP